MNTLAVAHDSKGNKFFFTGRAGQDWVSPNAADAWTHWTLEECERRVKNWNNGTRLHGLTFKVVV